MISNKTIISCIPTHTHDSYVHHSTVNIVERKPLLKIVGKYETGKTLKTAENIIVHIVPEYKLPYLRCSKMEKSKISFLTCVKFFINYRNYT